MSNEINYDLCIYMTEMSQHWHVTVLKSASAAVSVLHRRSSFQLSSFLWSSCSAVERRYSRGTGWDVDADIGAGVHQRTVSKINHRQTVNLILIFISFSPTGDDHSYVISVKTRKFKSHCSRVNSESYSYYILLFWRWWIFHFMTYIILYNHNYVSNLNNPYINAVQLLNFIRVRFRVGFQ